MVSITRSGPWAAAAIHAAWCTSSPAYPLPISGASPGAGSFEPGARRPRARCAVPRNAGRRRRRRTRPGRWRTHRRRSRPPSSARGPRGSGWLRVAACGGRPERRLAVAELLHEPRRPSISVKRNVTVPVGRVNAAAARARGSAPFPARRRSPACARPFQSRAAHSARGDAL
jgi:hypothetical protein